ncbi:MAG: hypothetical protein GY866_19055 [Proteobacteria bacterium]|nr:hypothetical protein [Pseudomonadota bacterium]
MESLHVREALNTAILLGEAAQSTHTVEIDGIGEVQIDGGRVALLSEAGKWKSITRENVEQRIKELMAESMPEKIKRRIKSFIFS